jgi:hypothetical protein
VHKLEINQGCRVLFQNKINLRYCASGWFYYRNILQVSHIPHDTLIKNSLNVGYFYLTCAHLTSQWRIIPNNRRGAELFFTVSPVVPHQHLHIHYFVLSLVSEGKTSSLSLGNWNIAEGVSHIRLNTKSLIRKHPLILSADPVEGTKAETAANDSQ